MLLASAKHTGELMQTSIAATEALAAAFDLGGGSAGSQVVDAVMPGAHKAHTVLHGSIIDVPVRQTTLIGFGSLETDGVVLYPNLQRAMAEVAARTGADTETDYLDMMLGKLGQQSGTVGGVIDLPGAQHARTFQGVPGRSSWFARLDVYPKLNLQNLGFALANLGGSAATPVMGHYPDLVARSAAIAAPTVAQLQTQIPSAVLSEPPAAQPSGPSEDEIVDWIEALRAAFAAARADAQAAGHPIDARLVRVQDHRRNAAPTALGPLGRRIGPGAGGMVARPRRPGRPDRHRAEPRPSRARRAVPLDRRGPGAPPGRRPPLRGSGAAVVPAVGAAPGALRRQASVPPRRRRAVPARRAPRDALRGRADGRAAGRRPHRAGPRTARRHRRVRRRRLAGGGGRPRRGARAHRRGERAHHGARRAPDRRPWPRAHCQAADRRRSLDLAQSQRPPRRRAGGRHRCHRAHRTAVERGRAAGVAGLVRAALPRHRGDAPAQAFQRRVGAAAGARRDSRPRPGRRARSRAGRDRAARRDGDRCERAARNARHRARHRPERQPDPEEAGARRRGCRHVRRARCGVSLAHRPRRRARRRRAARTGWVRAHEPRPGLRHVRGVRWLVE